MRYLGCESARSYAEENAKDDLLDLFAKIEYSHYTDNSSDLEQFTLKAENLIDVAIDYMKAGLWEDALYTLELADGTYPMVNYYRAYCENRLGRCGCEQVKAANACKTGYCFPSRIEDILVLENAINTDASGANAYYYLGCLCYDKFRYTDAAKAWENCVANDGSHGKAWRNLALYYFDKSNDKARARICMEKALEFKDDDPRLLLEYEQLLKNMNCTIEERLAVYEKYPELLKERDD